MQNMHLKLKQKVWKSQTYINKKLFIRYDVNLFGFVELW